ncbi:MAG: hydroxylamine oxidase [Desulfobacteraceae bacterium]|nr:hydroxylamine oxidase [Desulfobacteraceae bacterium]
MRVLFGAFVVVATFLVLPCAYGEERFSSATRECLDCHATLHPGIVSSWRSSRHAAVTPSEASQHQERDRKVSFGQVPDEMKNVTVGCAECHTLDPKSHQDSFEHNGHSVHVVVSPKDCGSCHAEEAAQYDGNLMSRAYGNLVENDVYKLLSESVNGNAAAKSVDPTGRGRSLTDEDSCLYCHGTKMSVAGVKSRETEMGSMEFPDISGWPNQGVGRINPDGSRGSCSACHSRHEFSMEMARKPYTCKECHAGPDVPASKVFEASKHGNIFSARNKEWDFQPAGWTVGKDFSAPTCAACHMSLLLDAEGKVIVSRTHEMKDRLPWRIFGIVYAHSHPRDPDTTIIRNRDGLPLPTDLAGGTAEKFLVTRDQAAAAQRKMQAVCLSCHARSWVDGHWERFLNTIESTNATTLAATRYMQEIWKKGPEVNHEKGGNPFDESTEKIWTDIWLFYANTVRFSSAMGGGGDYGVFADGRYQMQKAVQQLKEASEGRGATKEKPSAGPKRRR